MFGGQNVYDPDIDPGSVRSEIGMVFQRPNPFPTKSIFENAIIGVRLARSAGDRRAGRHRRERAAPRTAVG